MRNFNINYNKRKYSIQYYTKVSEFLEDISKETPKLWGLDIETGKKEEYLEHKKAGLNPNLSFIRLVQLYNGTDTVYICDFLHTEYIQRNDLREWLKDKKFVAHNAIFELSHFQCDDFKELECSCSMILGILVDRAERSPFQSDEEPSYRGYGLAALAKKYLGRDLSKVQQTSNWNAPKLSKSQIVYAAVDSIVCYDLAVKLLPKIKKYKMLNVYKLFKKMQHVIVEMQLQGMPVNQDKHFDLIKQWEQKKDVSELRCKKYFGDINIRSSKQLNEWLESQEKYEKILKIWPRTPAGKYSFNRQQIVDFLKLKPIAALMEYKKYDKLLSTYGESLMKHLNPVTNRYHTQFNLAQVRTGRLSSHSPNLQNIPRDSGIRDMFDVSGQINTRYVVADFSQIEMRVAGELSKDRNMRSAYRKGKDLHTIMASVVSGVSERDVTKEQRQLAKAVNFGFLFGMGASKFVTYAKGSYGVDVSEDDAWEIRNKFYDLYSDYIAWCTRQRVSAEKLGYVRTPMGRIRKLLDNEVYTKAVNTPVQGGAAEVLFLTMLILKKRLVYLKAKLASCVHDEIIIECRADMAEQVKLATEDSMRKGMLKLFPNAPVNGLTEAHVGLTWDEAK